MKSYTIIFTAFLSAAMLTTGCERDTEKPSMNISSPAENTTYSTGDKVHIEADFSDNDDLEIVRIFIGDEGGYEHPEFAFEYLDKNIIGETQHVHEHVYVPAGIVNSIYYVHFHVKDKAGNTLGTKVRINIGS